jgi:ArsR family transcriptional regulator, lead/cadmium/zinc/bismuth-responsive transcriptional repressor
MSADHCDLLCLDLEIAEKLRRRRVHTDRAEAAAARAGALADPTRLALAATLLEAEELCVCDLSWILERPQGLVSHHARRLREQAIVRSRRDGKMVLYSLTVEGRQLLESLLEVSERAEVARG